MFVIGEAFALGIVSGVVGIGLAIPIVELGMGRWLEENMGAWFPYFRIDSQTYVAAIVLAAALAVLASLLPARRAAQLSVANALRRVA